MDKLHNIYIKTLILALLIFNLNITICFAQEDDDLYKFENYLLNQGLNKINNNNISFDLSFNDRNDFGLNGNIDSIFGIYAASSITKRFTETPLADDDVAGSAVIVDPFSKTIV